MALQKTVVIKGVTIPDAYIKISRFGGDKSSLQFSVGYHAGVGEQQFHSETYSIDPFNIDSPNPIEQAYNHLKSLGEFSGCKDV